MKIYFCYPKSVNIGTQTTLLFSVNRCTLDLLRQWNRKHLVESESVWYAFNKQDRRPSLQEEFAFYYTLVESQSYYPGFSTRTLPLIDLYVEDTVLSKRKGKRKKPFLGLSWLIDTVKRYAFSALLRWIYVHWLLFPCVQVRQNWKQRRVQKEVIDLGTKFHTVAIASHRDLILYGHSNLCSYCPFSKEFWRDYHINTPITHFSVPSNNKVIDLCSLCSPRCITMVLPSKHPCSHM